MEKQRHQQKSLDHQTSNTSPKFKTPLSIERHAAKIYTRKVFLKVQDEIYHAIWSCMQISCIFGTEDMMCCCIREKKAKNRKGEKENYVSLDVDGEDDVEDSSIVEVDHQVSFSKKKGTVACSCMMFLRFGLLCRHIFCVYRVHDVVMIPSEYVLRRWTRDIVPSHLLQKPDWHGETSCARDKIRNKMHSLVDQIVMYSGDDMDQLEHFLKNMEAMKEQLESQGGPTKAMKKADIIKSFVGCDKPSDLSIQNPQGIRNKGCGSSRRMIGQREKAVVDSQKPKRMCKNCNKMSTHDSRNCPLKFSDVQ